MTLASITFQNYFRLYKKLAGMTGTASTEADEFAEIYKLDVVEIPTNLAGRRASTPTTRSIAPGGKAHGHRHGNRERQRQGPAHAGRHDLDREIRAACRFSQGKGYKMIDFGAPGALDKLYASARSGKPSKNFAVLNARFHEQEAYIVAEAGVPGAITIATNMAGRGTDIQLGGNLDMRLQAGMRRAGRRAREAREGTAIRAEVAAFKQKALAAGGLYIIGTERHESRRIDNQLRGRSGRQGDPGKSKFFLSLQDDLMRIFGSERMDAMLRKLGLQEGEAIIHPWINKALEKAQQKVEARNFDMRKNVLKFDNVMNDQRKVVFEQRREMMAQDSLEETIAEMRHGVVDDLVAQHSRMTPIPRPGTSRAFRGVKDTAQYRTAARRLGQGRRHRRRGTARKARKAADEAYAAREKMNSPDLTRYIEKQVVLQTLDHFWREHLVVLDHLRQVIGWRGMAQRDPLNEYKSEAFELFDALITRLARSGHGAADARRGRPERPAEPQLPPMQASHFDPLHRRGRTGPRRDQRPDRRRRVHAPRARARAETARAARPERSGELGPRRPQRALSLRLGQEIQALPRRGGLRPFHAPRRRAGAKMSERRAGSEAEIAEVLVPVAVDQLYSYVVPDGMTLAEGDFVTVSLGSRDPFGVVWALRRGAPEKLKSVIDAARPAAAGGEIPRSSSTGSPPGPWRRAAWFCAWRCGRRKTRATNPRASAVRAHRRLAETRRRRRAQRVLAAAEGDLAMGKSELARRAGVSPGVIDALVDDGALEAIALPPEKPGGRPDPDFCAPPLSPDQAEAAQALREAVAARAFKPILLEGVTGSGKTEVYFEAVAEALRDGGQALILLPEIALTAQFLERFAARFGQPPGGMAFRPVGAPPRARSGAARPKATRGWWPAPARRCSCPSPTCA